VETVLRRWTAARSGVCNLQQTPHKNSLKEGVSVTSKKTTDGRDAAEGTNGFSRRTFLHGAGAAGVLVQEAQAEPVGDGQPVGPDPVDVTLRVNGKDHKLKIEPRVTLLDALRNRLDHTGAKKVCDRGTCGACTVIIGGEPVYACSMLALEAEGRNITTVESLSSSDDKLHPVQSYFVDHDAQQCGFCTPGLVMAAKALLDKNPQPTIKQVEEGLSGNICRCGTYVGVRQAVYEAGRNGGRRGD
jgi:aerobic-type carbon monoxide dehydrogenase small subunit (CoxS/CutS family)